MPKESSALDNIKMIFIVLTVIVKDRADILEPYAK
jgi:hypothetical protein